MESINQKPLLNFSTLIKTTFASEKRKKNCQLLASRNSFFHSYSVEIKF